jgi:DNA replication and repair protein RecF
VFHVEHPYAAALSRYQHALKQRNSALQRGPAGGVPEHIWNKELADNAVAVDAARARYFALWLPWVNHYLEGFLSQQAVSIRYDRGWPAEEEYLHTLERASAEDRQLGYTRYGPHRANIHIGVNGVPAEQCVSRGQQKLLVMALAFAQAAVLNAQRGDHCVVLIDDLAAELDAEHRQLAMHLLAELGGQSILAVTEPHLLEVPGLPKPKMFHVEHGTVQEVL